jgi:ribosomal protein L7Ae-like RNA K-turn-binding protein
VLGVALLELSTPDSSSSEDIEEPIEVVSTSDKLIRGCSSTFNELNKSNAILIVVS